MKQYTNYIFIKKERKFYTTWRKTTQKRRASIEKLWLAHKSKYHR